ncbi:MAG: helix-turn-helix domain-containing protein [Anaerolineae bacterium]
MGQLSEKLRLEREARGLTLSEVEAKTRIKSRFLEAMEAGDFGAFPSEVAARGLIRNYATYLGLDPDEILTLYHTNGADSARKPRLQNRGIQFVDLSLGPRSLLSWDLIIGLLVVTALLGGAGLLFANLYLTEDAPPPPPEAVRSEEAAGNAVFTLPTPTPEPTLTPTPTFTPTPEFYTGVAVEVVISERSWVQILVDDVKQFEGVLEAGERRNWSGDKRVAIRAGNAGGVEVIVNGQSQGVMGEIGQVVDQVWEKVESPPEPSPAEATATPADSDATFGFVETPEP